MNWSVWGKWFALASVVLALVAIGEAFARNSRERELAALQGEVPYQVHEYFRREALAALSEERRGDLMKAGVWLDSYYRSAEGLQRPDGLLMNGHPDWEGISACLFDVYLRERLLKRSDAEARAKVVESIEQTDEWRSKHARGR